MKPAAKIIVALAIGALLGFAAWECFPSLRAMLSYPAVKKTVIEDIPQGITGTIDKLGEAAKQVSAPGPLVSRIDAVQTRLTRAGVILLTNVQRKDNGGLAPLDENGKLDSIAEIRLKDMFEKQYFAHEYPGGIDFSAGAKTVGYDYVTIGENIALGDFGDDKGLVQAWMDSPGHRANILNTSYTQIGVAVGQGIFEGRATWIGVQIFGKPASDCPQLDAALNFRIDGLKADIDRLYRQATEIKTQIDGQTPRGKKEVEDYSLLIDQYNGTVTVLDGAVAEVKKLIEQYNADVQAYNACAST